MFSLLSQKLQTMPEIDRNLSIVFDEMDIQPRTRYSPHFKERLPKAKKALVVIVRGLRSSFKEVVYYNFDTVLERDRGKAGMDMSLLKVLIQKIEKCGGSVRSITLDMGNRTLLSECKVKKTTTTLPPQSMIGSIPWTLVCLTILTTRPSLV